MGLLWNANQHFYPSEMRLFSLFLCLACLLVASCGRHKPVSKHENPDKAAIHYMQLLVNEDYGAYVSGMLSCDSASEQYKRNMAVLLKQMTAELKQSGAKVKSVSCDSCNVSNEGERAKAYVAVSFADGKSETVVVPLIWSGKRWRLY